MPEFIIRPRTPGSNLPAIKPPPRRRSGIFGWILLLLLLAGSAAAAWHYRDLLAARISGLDELIGGIVGSTVLDSGAVLEIPRDRISFAQEGSNTLVIKGVIVNPTGEERDVPGLELTLAGAGGVTVATHAFTARAARIAANGSVEYETRVENVPPAAQTMTVRFVAKR